MEKTYKKTFEKRKSRTRETYNPFVEKVLDIGQSLILPLNKLANASVSSNYIVKGL